MWNAVLQSVLHQMCNHHRGRHMLYLPVNLEPFVQHGLNASALKTHSGAYKPPKPLPITAAFFGRFSESGIDSRLSYYLIMFAFTRINNGNETTSYNLRMMHYSKWPAAWPIRLKSKTRKLSWLPAEKVSTG